MHGLTAMAATHAADFNDDFHSFSPFILFDPLQMLLPGKSGSHPENLA
jgi:hypothetical protein